MTGDIPTVIYRNVRHSTKCGIFTNCGIKYWDGSLEIAKQKLMYRTKGDIECEICLKKLGENSVPKGNEP